MSSYIIQQPGSLTNPSKNYRILAFDDWIAFVDGDVQTVKVHGEAPDYATAVKLKDELNAAASR